MTMDEVRAVHLSLPDVQEGSHHGHPDFRVDGLIFASLFPDKDLAVLRLPVEMAEAVVAEAPSARRLASRSGGAGWVQFQGGETPMSDFLPLAEIACNFRRKAQK